MSEYILEMNDISKEFTGVKALSNVNFKVKKGEIHCLIGENGAGKSTLMKVLSGVYPYGTYQGDIVFEGEIQQFNKISDSVKAGIGIIYQELALFPDLTVYENIFVGNEVKQGLFVDWNQTIVEANKMLKKVKLSVTPETLIKDLGVGKQQLVEIAKALSKDVKLLILDEPTAALNEDDSENLLELLNELKNQGISCIMISHKLKEVISIADKATVIRDGRTICTLDSSKCEISEAVIIKNMVGREINDIYPKRINKAIGERVLELSNWSAYDTQLGRHVVKDVNLHLKKGEIIGIAGLMGSGRTELALSIFGNPKAYKIQGELMLDANGVINPNEEVKAATEYKDSLYIKASSLEQVVGNLSGGNQQKVSLGKWLFTEPKILILDEPTRGIDVGAKFEIYTIMNKLISEGMSIIMISSELGEILGMSDRVYVMAESEIKGELTIEEATQEKIMELATQ